ncbi:MAG: hypothetical protein ACE5EA_09135 [Nitrospirota bacterium]
MRFFRLTHIPFQSKRIFIDTAVTYILGKSLIIFLTLLFVSCIRCNNRMSYIMKSVIHMLIFTHFIYLGLSLAMMILFMTMTVRVMIYLINFIYPHQFMMNIPFLNKNMEIMSEPVAGTWVFLVKALLAAIIAYMLIRAIRTIHIERRNKRRADGKKSACPMHNL